jgi:hypothetical protein
LKQVEKRLARDLYLNVQIWGEDGEGFAASIRQAVVALGMEITEAGYDSDLIHRRMLVEFQVKRTRKAGAAELMATLGALEGVRRVKVQ